MLELDDVVLDEAVAGGADAELVGALEVDLDADVDVLADEDFERAAAAAEDVELE